MNLLSHGNCACCSDLLAKQFDRRRFLQISGAAALAAAVPATGFAASGNYEAMLLTCIDPRFQEPIFNDMKTRNMTGKYSQFTIAGAAIGVVAEPFKDWHKAFWDNLATSIELHKIKNVIAINHRDCGAAKIAYGENSVVPEERETETHRAALAEFRKQVGQRHPNLGVETGLMAIDGTIQMFS